MTQAEIGDIDSPEAPKAPRKESTNFQAPFGGIGRPGRND